MSFSYNKNSHRRYNHLTNYDSCLRSNIITCRDSLIEKCNQIEKIFEFMRNGCREIGKQIVFLCESYRARNQNRKTKSSHSDFVSAISQCASVIESNFEAGNICQSWFPDESSKMSSIETYISRLENEVLIPIEDLIEKIPKIEKLKKKIIHTISVTDDNKKKQNKSENNLEDRKSIDFPNVSGLECSLSDNYSLCIKMNQFVKLIVNQTFKMHQLQNEISRICLKILEIEQTYHTEVIEIVNTMNIDVIKLNLNNSPKIFGKPLKTHLKDYNCDIAPVIDESIAYLLLENGLNEEGIFRIAPNKIKVQKLQAAYDSGIPIPKSYVYDVHVIAALMKQYLRDLPNSLLCNDLNEDWIDACKASGSKRVEAIGAVLSKLPIENYNNLKYLMYFLHEVVKRESTNKMTIMNISVIFGPTLLSESTENAPQLATGSSHVTSVVECLLRNLNQFFPQEPILNQKKFIRIVYDSNIVANRVNMENNLNIESLNVDVQRSSISSTENEISSPYQFYNISAYRNLNFNIN